MRKFKKMLILTLTVVFIFLLGSVTAFSVSALDAEFEKEIAAFPESYKPYLRKLHEQYPLWEFEPFITGLDWQTVIDNEHDDYALVYNSTAARIFKSLDPDDYDPGSDYFYYKDGGFVAGSRVAVEYFMDPRNFLDKGGIFQFELLNFSNKNTVEMVDAVLEGSFMHKKKMTYVDASGKSYTDTLTYAQAIYKAGQTYNINPCFIASKILNEVGSSGSDSVSGKNSSYPGIYNFYNIGATDGAGAIERGLLWASGNGSGRTSYSRPWTTPYKSIMGGAEFLAEDYISAGQFTGYLQRFNVNPDSDYNLYSHQYMSNLTGALTQGYSTYASYYDMNMLNSSITFSIPVFKNMSDEKGDGSLIGAEGALQYGTINVLYTGVRKGPSVDHARVTDSSGNTIWLDRGEEVRIIGKCDTDAYYHSEILSDPYWYKIAFTVSGVSYTGYIPGEYIDIKTAVHVTPGITDISIVKSSSVKNKIFYSDPTMVRVIDDNTVEFLKNGTVSIYLYDSVGNFEEILFKVGSYASYYPKNLTVNVSDNSIEVGVDKNDKALSYGFSLADSDGAFKPADFLTSNTSTFKNLKSGTVYTVYAQNCYGKYALTKAVEKTVITKPQTVQNLQFVKNASGTAVLSWKAVENATGYQVLSYNDSTGKYTSVLLAPFGTNSCTLTAAQAAAENFVVRAYCKYGSQVSYGEISNVISLSERPSMPDGVKVSGITATGYNISWNGNSDSDGYQVWISAEGEEKYSLYKETAEASLTVSGLKNADIKNYRIRAFKNTAGGRLYSVATSPVTAITAPAKPSKIVVTPGSGRVLVSWTAVSGATEYTVLYRKVGGEIKTLTATGKSLLITGLDCFSDYYFAVSATVKYGNISVSGSRSSVVAAKTKPATVKNISVLAVAKNYIDIQWTADKSLDKYKVHVLDMAGNVIGSKVLTDNKIRLKPLNADTSYKIIIRGYKLENGKYISSENSETLVASTFDTKISTIKVSALSNSADVYWNSINNADYYGVFLYENGKYVLKKTTSDNYCTLENLKDCSTNNIAVRAYFKSSSGDYYGEHTIYKFYTRPLSVEKIIQSNRTDTSYTLTWEKSSSPVNRYFVYRYNESTKKYDLLGSTSKTTCNIKGMTPGTIQRYAVIAAVVKDGKTLVSSKHTYTYSCGTYLSKTENLRQTAATENALRIAWNPVEGATEYRVYYYDTAKKQFRLLGATASTVATFRNLSSSTQYIFRVNAAKVTDDVTFVGYYSEVLYAETK